MFLTRYDDDFFVIRDKTAVKKTMEEIGNYFEIKRSNNVEDFRRDGSSIYLSQPNLIEKWCMRFKDNIKNHKEFETPTGPGVKLCNQNMKKLSSPRMTKKITDLEWDHCCIYLNIQDLIHLIALGS